MLRTTSWAISPTRRRPGEFLTRGDVCHLHGDRGGAERCGVALGGTPELVQLEEIRPADYEVVWSLSAAAGGRLRRRSAWPEKKFGCSEVGTHVSLNASTIP